MSNEFDRSGQDQPRNANYRPELMAEANFLSGEKTMSAGSRASIQALRTTILRSVSRSFYLSIRILPAQLCEPVALAYLLARTTDTVADTAQVSVAQRTETLQMLSNAIQDRASPKMIADLLASFAPLQENVAEQRLIESLQGCLEWLEHMEKSDRNDIR